jgi:hypothetical protein
VTHRDGRPRGRPRQSVSAFKFAVLRGNAARASKSCRAAPGDQCATRAKTSVRPAAAAAAAVSPARVPLAARRPSHFEKGTGPQAGWDRAGHRGRSHSHRLLTSPVSSRFRVTVPAARARARASAPPGRAGHGSGRARGPPSRALPRQDPCQVQVGRKRFRDPRGAGRRMPASMESDKQRRPRRNAIRGRLYSRLA